MSFLFSSTHLYNNVYDVPGGCILSIYIKDSAKAIRKANASILNKENSSLEDVSYSVGPYICVWQRENGKRYCKEVNYWPVDHNSNPLQLGSINNYGHRLVAIINSYNR